VGCVKVYSESCHAHTHTRTQVGLYKAKLILTIKYFQHVTIKTFEKWQLSEVVNFFLSPAESPCPWAFLPPLHSPSQ
jgi:hypothetical protein